MCVKDDGGGGEADLGYRTLWSHANQMKCTNVHWILESGTTPLQYKFSLDITFLGCGSGMIMEENVLAFRR